MSSRWRTNLATIAVALVFVASAIVVGMFVGQKLGAPNPAGRASTENWRPSEGSGPYVIAHYVRAIDGDTQEFRLESGRVARVRMIGINCPEFNGRVLDIYTAGPMQYADGQLKNKGEVYLELGNRSRDKFGQILAYVWLTKPPASPTTEDVRANQLNARMLTAGYAKRAVSAPGDTRPNTRYAKLYNAFLKEAQAGKRGMWDPAIAKESDTESQFFTTEKKAAPVGTQYVGNRRTLYFHTSTCKNAVKMHKENRVIFPNRERAVELGYRPCGLCNP